MSGMPPNSLKSVVFRAAISIGLICFLSKASCIAALLPLLARDLIAAWRVTVFFEPSIALSSFSVPTEPALSYTLEALLRASPRRAIVLLP